MALDLDTSKAFRFPDEVVRLVEAVVNAGGDDEASWIEWKERLDLSDERAFQHLPRTILGFANRDPSTSSHWAEGYAYLIVGAEPGGSPGITPIDPSDLSERIRAYVGNRIGWHPLYVTVNGNKVLVIAVEPPRPGDPIHALHKTLRNFEPGTLFVRLSGQTVRAAPQHVDMLEQRSKASAAVVDITATFNKGAIEEAPAAKDLVKTLVDQEREVLASTHPGPTKQSTTALSFSSDTRSASEFHAELGEYITKYEATFAAQVEWLRSQHEPSLIHPTLSNNTGRNFSAVQLSLILRGANCSAPDRGNWPKPPKPPMEWGAKTFTITSTGIVSFNSPNLAQLHKPTITQTDSGVRVDFPPVDLRPHAQKLLDPLVLLPYAADDGQPCERHVGIRWSVTATNADGQVTGDLSLGVSPATLDLSFLGRRATPGS